MQVILPKKEKLRHELQLIKSMMHVSYAKRRPYTFTMVPFSRRVIVLDYCVPIMFNLSINSII